MCYTFAVHIKLTLLLKSSCFYFCQTGGALFAYAGTIVVNSCVFLGNVASSESASGAYGRAIDVFDDDLSVLDCTFTKNKALQIISV